jgi:hypothetical protein
MHLVTKQRQSLEIAHWFEENELFEYVVPNQSTIFGKTPKKS